MGDEEFSREVPGTGENSVLAATKRIAKELCNRLGYDVSRIPRVQNTKKDYSKELRQLGVEKAHYGSGVRLLSTDWVNIDLAPRPLDSNKVYVPANLASKQPFESNFFKFAFAEDFLEHLDQSESLIFLSEVFRCLQPGGVLRLSFPGLRGILRRHYLSSDYEGASVGQTQAYTIWGHKHYFSEESLETVATHIGFSKTDFVEYGKSAHEDLSNLDSRPDQRDLNIYAELTK